LWFKDLPQSETPTRKNVAFVITSFIPDPYTERELETQAHRSAQQRIALGKVKSMGKAWKTIFEGVFEKGMCLGEIESEKGVFEKGVFEKVMCLGMVHGFYFFSVCGFNTNNLIVVEF
jgi:hypothetical protein